MKCALPQNTPYNKRALNVQDSVRVQKDQKCGCYDRDTIQSAFRNVQRKSGYEPETHEKEQEHKDQIIFE